VNVARLRSWHRLQRCQRPRPALGSTKQTVWQIYLPAPRRIPLPMFDEDSPNAVHQADLLYLPHDRVGRKTYKYALTVVDVASRYKEAEALTDKSAAEVAAALDRIYKRGPLTWPRLLQVDPGREFMGAVNQLLAKHNTQVRRGRVDTHRDQGIVERFNRTLAERLFGSQYAQELLLAARGSSERSREWVRALPAVVAAINDEPTRLTGKKPSVAIKAASVAHKPSAPAGRVVCRGSRILVGLIWFATCTSLASWKVAGAGPRTPCGR
jgi:hypothetical protein